MNPLWKQDRIDTERARDHDEYMQQSKEKLTERICDYARDRLWQAITDVENQEDVSNVYLQVKDAVLDELEDIIRYVNDNFK